MKEQQNTAAVAQKPPAGGARGIEPAALPLDAALSPPGCQARGKNYWILKCWYKKFATLNRATAICLFTGASIKGEAALLFSAVSGRTRRKRPAAPLLVAPAYLRAPSIEGSAPPAALCEDTASSAGSPMSLGVITAGQWRALTGSRGAPRPAWAGCLRREWQVKASGRCEKHPIMAFEQGRSLGAVP